MGSKTGKFTDISPTRLKEEIGEDLYNRLDSLIIGAFGGSVTRKEFEREYRECCRTAEGMGVDRDVLDGIDVLYRAVLKSYRIED